MEVLYINYTCTPKFLLLRKNLAALKECFLYWEVVENCYVDGQTIMCGGMKECGFSCMVGCDGHLTCMHGNTQW